MLRLWRRVLGSALLAALSGAMMTAPAAALTYRVSGTTTVVRDIPPGYSIPASFAEGVPFSIDFTVDETSVGGPNPNRPAVRFYAFELGRVVFGGRALDVALIDPPVPFNAPSVIVINDPVSVGGSVVSYDYKVGTGVLASSERIEGAAMRTAFFELRGTRRTTLVPPSPAIPRNLWGELFVVFSFTPDAIPDPRELDPDRRFFTVEGSGRLAIIPEPSAALLLLLGLAGLAHRERSSARA